MTAEEYKKEAESKVAELQKKVGTVIKKDPVYYSQYNEKRYNYIYDPFEHKWITYEPNQISNGRAKDSSNVTLVRIEMIIAAINQGLSFTANPMVCRDEDGNYYDYNKESGTFIKRV